ncbi:MAG: DNA double-strand break repair nuclease NurA [Candidatus Nezhaarchaeota archaeon]|nr:DNA double-strand break repair nuclease NurA [Candidatus Nezhaarchaeota archaeon]
MSSRARSEACLIEGLDEVVEGLSRIYEASMNKASPRPLLRVGGKVIVGLPLTASSFHPLRPLPSEHRFLSADASLKALFDCGGLKVVVVKTAAAVWRLGGLAKRYPSRKRLALVSSREEAQEVVLRAEAEAVLWALRDLGEGDLCILDRPLASAVEAKRASREVLKELSEECRRRGVALLGVCKSSRLRLNTGEPLIGYLNHLGSKLAPGRAWFYYPLFQLRGRGFDFIGEPVAVKFSGDSPYVFRVDVEGRLDEGCLELHLGELAALQDTATPGIPYPLLGAHEEAKVSRHEAELDRMRLLEALEHRGLLERFLAGVKSTSFKEEEMWGSLLEGWHCGVG